ncbi:MAG: hypothetical protein HKN12_04765, partial [Gemmatimonadetes bacterium]|nr:hypothetical protein [Gemmatimonadota bacterium]
MTECALLPLDDSPVSDGIFDVDDRFLLFAHGVDGWASAFDPALPRTDWIENPYTEQTFYWVTWGGSFADPPKRMTQRTVPPSGSPTVATMPWREHFEENNLEDFRFPSEDGWHWENLLGRGEDRLYLAFLDRVGAVGDGAVSTRILSHGTPSEDFVRDVEIKVGGAVVADSVWNHGGNRAKIDMSGCFQNLLVDGPNAIRVNARELLPNSLDRIYTTWFDVEYNRKLVTEFGSYLHFVAPVAPPAEVTAACSTMYSRYGQSDFLLQDFGATTAQDIFLFDVSAQHDVVNLTGFQVNVTGGGRSNVAFSDPGATADRWYIATTMEGVLPHPPAEMVDIRNLRSASNGAEYVVLYHEDFQEGAERLAELRSRNLPGGDSFKTLAISMSDVYNEFSWGVTDPTAIRDFLAYTLNNWAEGAPVYVTLVGDAAYDTKKYLPGSPDNLLGTYTGRYRTEPFVQYVSGDNLYFYPTDDFYGYADTGDYQSGAQPTLDFAIGRYPVQSEEDLDLLLDKLEDYLSYETPGQWQNRVILTADDERTLSDTAREPWHTDQVETLARERIPPSIDKVKVYLTEYPRNDFGKKPSAQEAFIEEFTRGALMVTYTGHGDQNTMAQEEVFVSQKIAELLNEVRYTVFSTFSCTVSRFDLLSGNSMTELMLLHEDGGAVTTFASAGLVFPQSSAILNQEWLGFMFGTPYPVNT